jgi:hypothetical protein
MNQRPGDPGVPDTLRDELPRPPAPLGLGPRLAVGCLTLVAGAFGGGMILVLVGKIVGTVTGCQPEPDLPACHWHLYAGAGMLLGGIMLPILALIRLRRVDPPPAPQPERGGSGTS